MHIHEMDPSEQPVWSIANEFYQATVQIRDAEFISTTGVRVRLPYPVTLTAAVGMMAGG